MINEREYCANTLYEYSKQIFPEFAKMKYLGKLSLDPDKTADGYKLMQGIFTCFLKGSFYRMESVSKLKQNKKYRENINYFRGYFYNGNSYDGKVNSDVKNVTIYLFKTGELNQWISLYNYDLFKYFFYLPGDNCPDGFDFSFFHQ